MNNTNYFLFCSVVLLMASSCKTETKYPKDIMRLDSLYNSLVKSEKEYELLDTVGMNTIYKTTSEQIQFIQQNQKDTLNFETALLLSNYHGILKPVETFNSRKKEVEEETEYSKKQVQGLIHDLKSNLLPADSVNFFVQDEVEATEEALASMEMMKHAVQENKEKFDRLNPGIQEMISKLKNTAPH